MRPDHNFFCVKSVPDQKVEKVRSPVGNVEDKKNDANEDENEDEEMGVSIPFR